MARNIDLNKLRLEADEDGFTLHVPTDNEAKPTVKGDFDEPETVTCYKFRKSVLDSYVDQEGVEAVVSFYSVDAGSEREIALEAQISLEPGFNWFELDHTVFNEVYCDSA